MEIEELMKSVLVKLKEALLTVENWPAEALAWFDGVFPPETRGDKVNHLLNVALPYLIAGVVLTVVVCLCRCCCCGSRKVKMMKAPGRNRRMPRDEFVKDPKAYFRKLRSHPRK